MWCSARSCMTVKWLLEPLMSLGPCQSVFKLATMAVTSAGLTPWTTWNVVGARTENNLECYAFKMFSEISKKEYVGDHGLMLQLSQCIRWESDWQSKTGSRQTKCSGALIGQRVKFERVKLYISNMHDARFLAIFVFPEMGCGWRGVSDSLTLNYHSITIITKKQSYIWKGQIYIIRSFSDIFTWLLRKQCTKTPPRNFTKFWTSL